VDLAPLSKGSAATIKCYSCCCYSIRGNILSIPAPFENGVSSLVGGLEYLDVVAVPRYGKLGLLTTMRPYGY
jgi:hypothetical protein